MNKTTPPNASYLPGAQTALALLLGINLFNYIDRQVLAAVVPNIREAFFAPQSVSTTVGSTMLAFLQWFEKTFGFSPENTLIGTLSMAFMVVYMLAAPIFGRLSEQRPRWLLIGIGVILWSLASGASGFAATFSMLLITRCFVGIGEAAYGPAAPALISDYFRIENRGQVMAWFYMAIPVGSALGYILGGTVADSSLGWRWAFYIVVIPGLLLGILAFFMKDPPRGMMDLTQSWRPKAVAWRDYLILLRTPSYVLSSLGMCAMTFAIGGIGFWMVDYIKVWRHQTGPVAKIFGAILVVSGLLATLLGGMAGDKLRARYPGSYFLVSGVAMLLGLPVFLGVLYTPFPYAWILVFFACFCLFFNTGPTNTILANVTHPALRSAAFALNIFVIHAFGDVISPVIIGMITDKTKSMNTAFLVVAVMFVVSGVIWLCGIKYLEKDTQLANSRISPTT